MDHLEQEEAFDNDLNRLINRYADEFELSYAAVIGILMMKVTELCQPQPITPEDDEDED